jgi:hypothetical protein
MILKTGDNGRCRFAQVIRGPSRLIMYSIPCFELPPFISDFPSAPRMPSFEDQHFAPQSISAAFDLESAGPADQSVD